MRDLLGRLCALANPERQSIQVDRKQFLVAFVQHRVKRAEYLVRVPFLRFGCGQNADMVEWTIFASHLNQSNFGVEVRNELGKPLDDAHFGWQILID